MTGMGKALISLVLMSAITSFPELVVGLSSAAIVKSADLATGDMCLQLRAAIADGHVYAQEQTLVQQRVAEPHSGGHIWPDAGRHGRFGRFSG